MLRNSLFLAAILICAFNSNTTANVDRCNTLVNEVLQTKTETIGDDVVTELRSFGYDAVDAIASRIDAETKLQNPNHQL